MKANWQAWALLIILSLIWGSSFILIKKSLLAFTPFQVGSLRNIIAGMVMLPIALKNISILRSKKAFYIFLFGMCNSGIPAFLFAIAEQKVSSSVSGVLNSMTPLFTLLWGSVVFGVAFNMQKLAGVLLGFFGAAFIIVTHTTTGEVSFTSAEVIGYSLFILLACVLYGLSGNIVKNHLQEVPGKVISAYSYLFFAVPLVCVLFFTDFTDRLNTHADGLKSLAAVSMLAVFGSALAIILISKVIQKTSALFGSFVTYLVPFVALLWGIFDGERVGFMPLAGLALILGGIFLANGQKIRLRQVQEAN